MASLVFLRGALAAAETPLNAEPPLCARAQDACPDRLQIAQEARPIEVPPRPLVPWSTGSGSMPWSPQVELGPSFLSTRDFRAGGFHIAVGVRRYLGYDPNPLARSSGAVAASLGLLSMEKSALLGNELGLDLGSRLHWVSGDETTGYELLIETTIRPVSRVLIGSSAGSVPSVLGALLPAVGFAVDTPGSGMARGIASRYQGPLLRWSFPLRTVVTNTAVLSFVELDPSFSVVFPSDGSAPLPTVCVNINAGFGPLER